MGLVKGGFLRVFQTILYFICFCCAAVVLGIYSYFLAVQADRDQSIARYEKAVEGISGLAVLYTIFAVVLTCCLAGVSFFSFLGLVMDLLFVGGFVAIAIMTRHGATSCSGYVYTPLGDGESTAQSTGFDGDVTYEVSLRTACRMNTAVFAVSIIAIIFFLITAVMQIVLVRSHKKEKRYGPSPDNGYTSGPAKRRNFWSRKSKHTTTEKDAEIGAGAAVIPVGLAAPHAHDAYRPSHETGSTAVGSGLANNKYETAGTTGAPTGTHNTYWTNNNTNGAANPYGYDNTTTGTATNY